MEVLRHDYEFVEKITMLHALALKNIEEQPGQRFGSEDRAPSPGDGADEERPNFLGSHLHWTASQLLATAYTGPKGPCLAQVLSPG